MLTRGAIVRAIALALCASLFGAGLGGAAEEAGAEIDVAQGGATAEKTTPDEEPVPRPGAIEEITVRARKVEEKAQSTPVAVTPFSEAEMEREVTYNLTDLQGSPNVLLNSLGAFNATAFAVRGGSFQDIESSFEPAVGVVMDGVYIGRNATSLLDLNDAESVEVLRGPQGVLFGRNSSSGLVVARSRRPSGDFGTRGILSVGDRGFRDYRTSLDFPLVEEKIAANFAFMSQQSSGHYPNGPGGRLGDVNRWSIRGILEFTPNDDFDLAVIWNNFQDRSGGIPLNPASPPGTLFNFFGFGPDGGSPFNVQQQMHERNHTDWSDLILDMNYDLGPVTFTSITGWRSTKEDIWSDFDATSLALFESRRPQSAGQFSQEIRVATDLIEDVLNLTVGWYYYDSHYSLAQTGILDVCMFVAGCPSGAPGVASFEVQGRSRQSVYSNGYFGQLIWSVTPLMNMYAGGRWTIDDKDFSVAPPAPVPGGAGSTSDDARWRKFTPKFGMDFQLSDDLFSYMQYSTGFRSGSFNGRAGTILPSSVGPYDSETRGSLEGGVKSDWLDDRMRVNLTGFYDRIRDMQLPIIVPTETVTQNVGKAEIWGLELEAIAKPLDAVTLWGSAGYLHAKYLDFTSDIDGDTIPTDNTGLDLIRAPRYYGHIEALYEVPLSDLGMLELDAQWTYFAHYSTTVGNEDAGNVPATSLYDGSVSYRPIDSAWRFTLYGKNLFNRTVTGGALVIPGLLSVNGPIAPRTYGVQVAWRYEDLGDLIK